MNVIVRISVIQMLLVRIWMDLTGANAIRGIMGMVTHAMMLTNVAGKSIIVTKMQNASIP